MNDALNHFIDMNRQNILDDLSAIVAVPSVSSDLSKVSEALDKVLELGRRRLQRRKAFGRSDRHSRDR